MKKLLVLEGILSAVYVFDVSAYPFIHVPFYLLTLLYFASIIEVIGLVKLINFVHKRLSRVNRYRESVRVLTMALAFAMAFKPIERG